MAAAPPMAGDRLVRPRSLEFFRVLLPGFESTLPLPSAFASHFMEENNTCATLWGPLGKCWHVKVHGDNKSVSFVNGWEKFAADHRLSIGDFLVFMHQGGLVFNVAIFDQTTCERTFDSFATSEVRRKRIATEENNSSRKEDKSEEIFERCRRQTSSLHSKRVAKEMETNAKKTRQECIEPHQDHKASTTMNRHEIGLHQFKIVMKNHHNRHYLEVPTSFGASNCLLGIRRLFIRDPKGHVWPTSLCHCKRSSHTRSIIGTGWKAFCVGNDLAKGDSCVFELKGSNELQVQIHRRQGLSSKRNVLKGTSGRGKRLVCNQTGAELVKPVLLSPPGQYTKRLKKANELEASEPIDSCNLGPQFMCTIFPTSLTHLTIPKAFLLTVDLSAVHRITLVDPKSRRWPVKVYQGRSGTCVQFRLRRGWRAFCIKNNVQVGDVCIFKLATSEGNDTFHVQVVK